MEEKKQALTLVDLMKHFDYSLFRWCNLHSWYKLRQWQVTFQLLPVWGNVAEHYPYHPKHPDDNPIEICPGWFWHFEMEGRDKWRTEGDEEFQKCMTSNIVSIEGRNIYLGTKLREFEKDSQYESYMNNLPENSWYRKQTEESMKSFMEETYPLFKNAALRISQIILDQQVDAQQMPRVCHPQNVAEQNITED